MTSFTMTCWMLVLFLSDLALQSQEDKSAREKEKWKEMRGLAHLIFKVILCVTGRCLAEARGEMVQHSPFSADVTGGADTGS